MMLGTLDSKLSIANGINHSSDFDFQTLLYPFSDAHFFDQYWEQKPLHISRNKGHYYDALFSTDALEQVLQTTGLNPPDIRVVQNQNEMLPAKYHREDGSLHLNQLYKAYDEGYTIILNGLQRFWPPLMAFCHYFQTLLSHRVVANCYFSPRQSKALHPHYDTHDVLVLQLAGSKQWKIHEPTQPVPLLNTFQPVFSEDQLNTPIQDVVLKPGDLMYIPRGFIHHAQTTETFSFHLTVGIYPSQWIDLIHQALVAISLKDERLRRALPVGYLNTPKHNPNDQELMTGFQELLSTVVKQANLQEGISLLSDQFIRATTPAPDGHFAQINELDAIDAKTYVEKRPNMLCRLMDKGFSVSLQFPGNTVGGPLIFRAAMDFIVHQTDAFQVEQLPQLNAERQLTLIRRLIRGGLLKVSDTPPGVALRHRPSPPFSNNRIPL